MSSFYERDADRPMPVASAIKSAFLIELFAEHAGALDQTSATFAKLTDDSSHPAFTHFSPAVQADIRRDLGQATVREVGRAMVRGTGVSNAVYNGAANLTTALLGGPAGLTKRIHARDPAFCDLMVRRYMLAARNEVDNEATARSLASVLQRVVTGKIEGIDNATLLAIQDILRGRDHPRFGHHLTKGGSLSSDPLTRVQSGAFPRNGHPLVYVIMLSQPDPADDSRTEAGHRLAALATALREALLK